jgi:phosphoribosylformylglycinamidine synthase
MNPRYGDLDPYHMATSAIDEAIRNCVAVGADPARIVLLDNFCWGDCEDPNTLGSLVRAAIACHDLAVSLGTPFISGKDSLNNEFTYTDPDSGERRTIAIPPTLLISAMGQVEDVALCVTMDLKAPGNLLYIVGQTREELGGSHWHLVTSQSGGNVPRVDPELAKATFQAVHQAIRHGLVRACHDLSEGGLAAAAAEMCFAGGLGALIDVAHVPRERSMSGPAHICFSESNSRFLCEVAPESADAFTSTLANVPHAKIGAVHEHPRLTINMNDEMLIDAEIQVLKEAWQAPFRW